MSDQPPNPAPPAPAPAAPYRGLKGAAVYGAFIAGLSLAAAAVAGVAFWALFRDPAPATWLAGRLALFGVAAGVGAGLSRWLAGAAFDRLWSFRFFPGDFGGIAGFFAGVFVAGWLGMSQKPAGEAEGPLTPGQPVEITGPTLDGGHFDLADLKGKVVLVDFWATWCPPCVAELPRVREVYQKYRGDGFEVVGVSLDNNRGRLAEFVKANDLPWPQVFHDEPGKQMFDHPLGRRYGIDAIPRMLVVDRAGRLANDGVRGEEIETAVAAALGKPTPWTDRALAAGRRAVEWLLHGLLLSPALLLLGFGVGGAAVGALAEAGLRRAWRRPREPAAV